MAYREVGAAPRLLQNGTRADRQRAALGQGGLPAVTDLIIGRSTMP
jgi:glutamate---cysteine ligase / carboxylate-amine ligase